ncbi:MAG: PQQ-binding-like beta-propeller repeat protein [Fuerstiella sp.]|nr:PQQ-binding-like beta-propeller repeat protein [Fuerstiella sp.]
MHRDYAPQGVKFFYIYKYLAHAGAKGYVQAYTKHERLLHIKEGKKNLGTEIPWLCDTMANDLKHALGDAPTSEFVIDPQGRIVRRRAWGNAVQLRKDLTELVGPVDKPTNPDDLGLKTLPPPKVAPHGIVRKLKRPGGMKPLRVIPQLLADEDPFYVKLRPLADGKLLSSGTGRLLLDFRLDPIYHVHWNNLTPPIQVNVETTNGVTVAPGLMQGPRVEQPSDIDSREFLVSVDDWNSDTPIRLKVEYFACNDEEGWCRPVSQRYAVYRREDIEDGYHVSPMAHAGVWPAFRGVAGNGLSDARDVPLNWAADTNVSWRTELPEAGDSSPVVSGDRVFITCSLDRGLRRSLYCFRRSDGQQLWVQSVDHDQVMPTHKTNPYCASTPLSVGNRVVVWHGSAGLFCYDHDGNELWSRDLGEFRHMWGYGSSPVFHKDRIVLNCGPGKRTFLTAIDLVTGSTLWQTNEPIEGDGDRNENGKYSGTWCTPVITRVGGHDQIVCSQTTRVNGYDPDTGDILWSCDGLRGPKGDLAYSSPVMARDICVVLGGFNGPAYAFKPGGSGDITESSRLWRVERNPQNIGSGVFVGKHVYVPDAGPGTLRCIEPETGAVVWQERMAGGTAWGSIVYADSRAYVTCQNGDTVVFSPQPEGYKQVAVNSLGEPSNSTPAVAQGQIFIRTSKALYCIGEEHILEGVQAKDHN